MQNKNNKAATAQIGDSNTAENTPAVVGAEAKGMASTELGIPNCCRPNGDDAASPKSTKLANHGSPVSKNNVALVPAIQKIESIKYNAPDFKDAKALKAAFEEADKEVKTKGTAAIDGQADVILALAKVQAILSQRGKEKMRREAGINQSWTEYYKSFQKEFDYDLTLRAIQYKIGELAGKKRKRKCSECHKTDGHATSCSKYKEPPPPHLTQLEAKLLDATSRAHEVVKAVKQSGNVNEAIADFEKNAPTPEKLVEYAERAVKPSVADTSTKLSKQPSNGLDYRKMLVDLLDQIERLGSRLPVELHMKCKQYRSTMGLPPNVGSKPNGNRKQEPRAETTVPAAPRPQHPSELEEQQDDSDLAAFSNEKLAPQKSEPSSSTQCAGFTNRRLEIQTNAGR